MVMGVGHCRPPHKARGASEARGTCAHGVWSLWSWVLVTVDLATRLGLGGGHPSTSHAVSCTVMRPQAPHKHIISQCSFPQEYVVTQHGPGRHALASGTIQAGGTKGTKGTCPHMCVGYPSCPPSAKLVLANMVCWHAPWYQWATNHSGYKTKKEPWKKEQSPGSYNTKEV